VFYVVAALLLLAPWHWWRSGAAQRWSRRAVGLSLVLGAVLQALPAAKFGSPSGLASIFADAATAGMPNLAATPVQALADALPAHASLANAVLIVVLLIVGAALLLDVFVKQTLAVAGLLTALAWWFGQGFGVFGGVGTDPNSGAIVLVLLFASWPWRAAPIAIDVDHGDAAEPVATRRRPLVATALAIAAVFVLPIVAATGLLGNANAQSAIGDSGGVVDGTRAQIKDFTLVDQRGQAVSTQSLRGKVIVISFLDPECYDSCPLLANEMANAVDMLGVKASDVALLAINVNPFFNHRADVAAFTNEHGLSAMRNWHFVTGTNRQVSDVLASFGQGITVPRVGMIGHPQTVLIIDRQGRQLAAINDSGNEQLTGSYEQLLSNAIRHYL
jgi:cytochrome oxidase Cu insertion factor (SCO1/SenC/PrrC family)